MTIFEIISITLFWIIIGVFICYKATWFKDHDYDETRWVILATIIFAPIVFIIDIFNRIFIQKWH